MDDFWNWVTIVGILFGLMGGIYTLFGLGSMLHARARLWSVQADRVEKAGESDE